jgi:hypothetical protein
MNTAVRVDYAAVEVASREITRVATTSRATDQLHPGVIGIGVAAYGALVSTLVLGFAGPSDIVVPFMIVLVCMVAFIGLPAWMGASAAKFWRRRGATEARSGSLREFLAGRFENDGGQSTGAGALALVTTVPISLALGAMAMVIVLNVIK